VKLSKYEFWLKQIAFLGHINSKGVISVDPSKIQDVLSWNALTSVGDIHSFLGLAGYYRRFINGSRRYVSPCLSYLRRTSSSSGHQPVKLVSKS
jgi:hypothetical protein